MSFNTSFPMPDRTRAIPTDGFSTLELSPSWLTKGEIRCADNVNESVLNFADFVGRFAIQ